MENVIGFCVNLGFIILALVLLALLLLRFMRQQRSAVTKAAAAVLDKQHYAQTVYGKKSLPREQELYTVTFLCRGKKLTFYTDTETYASCYSGQKGVLTFKGLKFIDFQPNKKQKGQ